MLSSGVAGLRWFCVLVLELLGFWVGVVGVWGFCVAFGFYELFWCWGCIVAGLDRFRFRFWVCSSMPGTKPKFDRELNCDQTIGKGRMKGKQSGAIAYY